MGDKLTPAVGQIGAAKCPACSRTLSWVGPGPGWMNSDQWDASKAGEYYRVKPCERGDACPGRDINNGNLYFGEIERQPPVDPKDAEITALRERVGVLEGALKEIEQSAGQAARTYARSTPGASVIFGGIARSARSALTTQPAMTNQEKVLQTLRMIDGSGWASAYWLSRQLDMRRAAVSNALQGLRRRGVVECSGPTGVWRVVRNA